MSGNVLLWDGDTLVWDGDTLVWGAAEGELPDVIVPAPVPPSDPTPELVGAVYRFVSVDTVSGQIIAEVPLRNWKWSRVHNGAGTLTADLQLPAIDDAQSRAYAAALVDAVQELRRCIYVEREGAVMTGYVIWASDYDPDLQVITIKGAELWSYFRRRHIRWDASYTDVDQHEIVRDLIATAQAQEGGNLGVIVDSHDSGVLRTRTEWIAEVDKNLGEAIEQLSEVEGGFDFRLDVVRAGDAYQRRLRLGTPRLGRVDVGLVWTLGGNLQKLTWPTNGSTAANSWVGLGKGEGATILRSEAIDAEVIDAGWPLLEDTITHKDVDLQATLDAHTAAALADARLPKALPKATVNGAVMPALGSWATGDDALIQVAPDTDARWPDGLDVVGRIVSYEVSDPDDGPELVDLIFEEVLPGAPIRGTARLDSEAAWRRDVNRRLAGVETYPT